MNRYILRSAATSETTAIYAVDDATATRLAKVTLGEDVIAGHEWAADGPTGRRLRFWMRELGGTRVVCVAKLSTIGAWANACDAVG